MAFDDAGAQIFERSIWFRDFYKLGRRGSGVVRGVDVHLETHGLFLLAISGELVMIEDGVNEDYFGDGSISGSEDEGPVGGSV